MKININNECLLILSEKEVLFTSEEEIIIFQSWRDSREQNGDFVFDGLDLFSKGLKHYLLQQQRHLTPQAAPSFAMRASASAREHATLSVRVRPSPLAPFPTMHTSCDISLEASISTPALELVAAQNVTSLSQRSL